MKINLPSEFCSPFRKTVLIGFLFLGLNQLSALASPAGYDYRSKVSGNWNDITSWERRATGANGPYSPITSGDIPDETAGEIIISTNDEITVTGSITADQITVKNGGNLLVSGSLTLPNGVQPGLIVNGNITIGNGGTLITNNHAVTGGEFFLGQGGTLGIGSPDGIWANHLSPSGNVGSVQVVGDRIFSDAATYIYSGTTAQVTGSGLPSPVNNLVINNAQGVTLSKAIEIISNLSLVEGKLKPLSYGITIASNATITPPAANKVSFVEGPLAVKASSPKVIQFPIGKGTNYRPLSLTIVTTSGENTYTAEQFDQAFVVPVGTTIPEQVDKISAIRYFTINKSGLNAVTANLTVNYGTDDNVTDAGKLALVKNNSAGWEYLGGTGATNGTGAITSANFTTFSSFMLANQLGGTNPLPVELISFTAKAAKNAITLNWKTASEKNNDRFEVERSLNGENFEKFATVKGHGTTNSANAYTITDHNPIQGLNYYRLKQIDLDGTFSYSQIVQAQLNTVTEQIKVYPNPANDQITISVEKPVVVKITNVLGQLVYDQEFKTTAEQVIKIANLKPGVYNLTFETEAGIQKQKFVKAEF